MTGEHPTTRPDQGESLMDLVLAATLEGIVDHDLLTSRTVYSDRFVAMLGYDVESAPPATPDLWLELSHEQDRGEVQELWDGHVLHGWPFHHTWRMAHAHGGYRWVLCRSVLRMTEGGEPARALSLFSDVTDEVEAHHRHRALVEAIPDSVLRISPAGEVVDLRRGGSPNEELLLGDIKVGDSVDGLNDGRLPAKLLELLQRAQEEKTLQSLEWSCDWEQGACYFDLRMMPCGQTDAVCVVRDITEVKVLELQLLQSQKLESIGQLAAGVAHEINTPTQFVGDNSRFLQDSFDELVPVLVACAELAKAVQSGSDATELAEKALAAVEDADIEYLAEEIPQAIQQSLSGIERISKIVRSMKEFSHPGETDMAPANLNQAIESTLTVATSEWKYVADLETDFDEDLPAVQCTAGELNQVFLNLIVNASHAIGDVVGPSGEAKGTIRVSTQRDGEYVEIRIGDTGGGIPKHIATKIFDPFFTTKGVGKGTGQGLAIAHDVVTSKHGGSLTFESEIGEGTTFIIRLPIEQPRMAAAEAD